MQFGQYGFQNLKTNKSVQGVMQNRHEHFLFFLKHIRTCYTIHSYLNVCFICCRTNPFVFFLSKLFLLIIRQYDWVGSISACMQKQVNFIKKDKIDRIFANPRKMFFLCRK